LSYHRAFGFSFCPSQNQAVNDALTRLSVADGQTRMRQIKARPDDGDVTDFLIGVMLPD